MKNVVELENYYSPKELKDRLAEFVEYYNHYRYHESIDNVTPADVFFERDQQLLEQRAKIKTKTMKLRRKNHLKSLLN